MASKLWPPAQRAPRLFLALYLILLINGLLSFFIAEGFLNFAVFGRPAFSLHFGPSGDGDRELLGIVPLSRVPSYDFQPWYQIRKGVLIICLSTIVWLWPVYRYLFKRGTYDRSVEHRVVNVQFFLVLMSWVVAAAEALLWALYLHSRLGPIGRTDRVANIAAFLVCGSIFSFLNLTFAGNYCNRRMATPILGRENPHRMKRGVAVTVYARIVLLVISLSIVPMIINIFLPGAALIEMLRSFRNAPSFVQLDRLTSSGLVLLFFNAVFIIIQVLSLISLRASVQLPIDELVELMGRVTRGDRSVRATVFSADEIGKLRAHFNLLVESLSQYEEALVLSEKQAVVGSLTTGLVHEIKNLLNPIGLLDMIEGPDDPDATKYYEVIRESRTHILELIEEVRALVRNESVSYELRPLPIRDAVEEAVRLVGLDEAIFRKKAPPELRVSLEYDGNCLMTKIKIVQVLINLLRNALQAVADAVAPVVEVRTRLEEHMCIVSVVDNGTGIEAEDIEKIWQPFYSTKGRHGTGIGLEICRRIVEGHGGEITCESVPGKGSTFEFTLSAEPDNAEPDNAEPDSAERVNISSGAASSESVSSGKKNGSTVSSKPREIVEP